MSQLIKNIEFLLAKAGLTENSLADAIGMEQSTLNRIMRGESADPRDKTIAPIAAYFKVSIEQLKRANLAGSEPEPRLTKPGSVEQISGKLEGIRDVHDNIALHHALMGLFSVLAKTRPVEAMAVAEAIRARDKAGKYVDGITLGPLLNILRAAANSLAAEQQAAAPHAPSPSGRKRA